MVPNCRALLTIEGFLISAYLRLYSFLPKNRLRLGMSEQTVKVSLEGSCVGTPPSTVSACDEVCQAHESVEALKGPQPPSPQFAIDPSLLKEGLLQRGDVLRSLFACGTIGAALCTPEGKLVAISPAFARMLDYQAGELLGTGYANLAHPQNPVDISQMVREIQSEELLVQSTERLYIQKSGVPKWCLENLSLVNITAGRSPHVLALIQDIQPRKETEEERSRLQERLFQAQKTEALGSLAAGIAHDFNNLLGVILGFASIVRLRLAPSDPLVEFVQMIEQSAERGSDLTRQLLAVARQGKCESVPIQVGEVLGRVVKIITSTFDRRIQVQTRAESGPLWVDANPGQLEQAILNLCINARDAMPEGGVLALESSGVTLGEGDSSRPGRCLPGNYTRITVRDTGVGIAPQLLGRIFDPFFTTKEPGRGSGLGLSMVYGMASSAGGFVQVESEVGLGSAFSIHLPLKAPPLERRTAVRSSGLEAGSGTVLVVDDEPMVLAFVEEGLKRLGYQVLTAVDGRQACEVYSSRSQQIDMVLLDMVMPGTTGLDACRRLREINPNVKVILSSGYSSGEVVREARLAGAIGFIGKPYSLEELSSALRRPESLSARAGAEDPDPGLPRPETLG
jgi:PAS domain S-box-containing protein